MNCARGWEIEASRDGRLTGDALTSAARHAAGCATCLAQIAYLDGLARALRKLIPPTIDEVALRRIRQNVVARVDAELAGRSLPPPRRRRRERLALVLAAALGALVGVAAYAAAPRERPGDRRPAARAPRIVVTRGEALPLVVTPVIAAPAGTAPAMSSAVGLPRSPAPSASGAVVSEDVAYLRAVRLVRQGRSAEARAAARDYLAAFPNGFREEEMRRVANDP